MATSKDLGKQLSEALAEFKGKEFDSQSSTRIKAIVQNIVGDDSKLRLNKSGLITVETADGILFKINE